MSDYGLIRVSLFIPSISTFYTNFLRFTALCALSPPKTTHRKPDKRTGKIYNSLIFKTRMLPCFNYLGDLFYIDKVKTIPSNIGDLLTEVGLAFWIMDDGGLGSNGTLNLHTDSYTLTEVNLLIDVLKRNFDINSRISIKRPGEWIIVILRSGPVGWMQQKKKYLK